MSSNSTCFSTSGTAPQLFASALNFLAATQCIVSNKTSSYDEIPELERYDFIIVGAGSAGSVVANRLSERSDWNILLLEAGPEPPIESIIPSLGTTLFQTKYDWQYSTKNDGIKHLAWRNDQLSWPRGKMLGGSSSMNSMVYVKGREHDYQCWSDTGNPSWSPENVKEYFKKAENLQDMKLNKDPLIYKSYGHKGPLVINSFNSTYKNINEKLKDAWNYLGIKSVTDINSAEFEELGLSGISRVTAQNGQRVSTYTAYLNSTMNRKNLRIVSNAFVTKILINDDMQAYGVEVDINGSPTTIYSNLEVILSAGSINSPQILMLSGIGPKEHLESKNITCIVDSPEVGKNLKDHLYVPIVIYGNKPGEEDTAEQMFNFAKYLYNKTGSLANGVVTDVLAFFSRVQGMSYPEFQSHLVLFWKKSSSARIFFSTFKDEIVDSFLRFNDKYALYLYLVNLLHPNSSGTVSLNTSDPYDHPIIDANYFGDDMDVQITVDGIKMVTKLVNSTYFKSIKAFIPRIDLAQCNDYEFQSDLYWKCYILQISGTVFHPIGTAKMGQGRNDSVVNNYLKVHDVSNLRVIDASVMPCTTSGNINGPTIMIGEMGSDMIKLDYE